MRLYRDLRTLVAEMGAGACVAIGSFDGLHRGHLAVIRKMLALAAADGRTSVVLTFDPHPQRVLRPEGAPQALMSPGQRRELLSSLPVAALVELPFTSQLAAVPAERFVEDYLAAEGRCGHIVVGGDFSFGAGGRGTPVLLEQTARRLGIGVTVVPLRRYRGAPISSTRIRQALREGRVGEARQMLGRPFAWRGTVIPGDRRGASLGFPTANMPPPEGLVVPRHGVYAAWARLRQDSLWQAWRPAVCNLGVRPTVGGQALRLETHLLDAELPALYGLGIEVAFVRRLREERRFASLDGLRAQIAADIARARSLLSSRPQAQIRGF